jgi:hypothetical protein
MLPPVLVAVEAADCWEVFSAVVEVPDEVLDKLVAVDAGTPPEVVEVAEVAPLVPCVINPAVTVTGVYMKDRSVWPSVNVETPGLMAPDPVTVSVQMAVVVPPTEHP